MTTVYIEDQYGGCDRYRCRMNIPFGLLFAWYLRRKDILLRGGIFLSSGKRIGLDETPKGLRFGPGYHVITFVNLFMFFDLNNSVYQSDYPLTIVNESKGVLNVPTMRDAINASIQRGHVVEVVPEGDELLPSPCKIHRVQERHETQFFQWSLYTAHHSAVIKFGDHSETEVLLEIEIIHWSGKAAKTCLFENWEWGGKMSFLYWLYYGLILIEILLSNVLVYRNGRDLSCIVGAKFVARIMRFIADGLLMGPDAPDNIMGRGQVTLMMEILHVHLPTAVQKMTRILEFCMDFGNSVNLPHTMNFSYLQCVWDVANKTLQVLSMPAVDWSVNPYDRNSPICLNLILLWKFRIPACGHLMLMSCLREYKTQINARSGVAKCPVCHFDTQGYCYQVQL